MCRLPDKRCWNLTILPRRKWIGGGRKASFTDTPRMLPGCRFVAEAHKYLRFCPAPRRRNFFHFIESGKQTSKATLTGLIYNSCNERACQSTLTLPTLFSSTAESHNSDILRQQQVHHYCETDRYYETRCKPCRMAIHNMTLINMAFFGTL